jgi:hypothetical protein
MVMVAVSDDDPLDVFGIDVMVRQDGQDPILIEGITGID